MGKIRREMPLPADVLEAFQFFDTDGTKSLDWPTFRKMVYSLGESPNLDKLDEYWKEACADGPADEAKIEAMWPKITYDNFSKMLKPTGDDDVMTMDEYDAALAKAKELSGPDCVDKCGEETKPAID